VIIILILDADSLFLLIEWCLHVIEIPDEIKIIVFSNGTFIGSNGLIYMGGQIIPISILGLILE